MANETPNRVHAGGLFVPTDPIVPPFTGAIVNSQGVQAFARLDVGQYQITLQRTLAFHEGYADAAIPANFQGVAGAQISEDGTSVLITVLALGTGEPVDPPIVGCTVWAVREGEGEGPAIPFPAIPPPLPNGSATKDAWFEAETSGNYNAFSYRTRSVGATSMFNFNFRIPQDFSNITSLVLIGAPDSDYGPDGEIDLVSNYGAAGESVDNMIESTSLLAESGSLDVWGELDLASVFTGIAAGDYCGVEVDHVTNIGTMINYIGIRLRYA